MPKYHSNKIYLNMAVYYVTETFYVIVLLGAVVGSCSVTQVTTGCSPGTKIKLVFQLYESGVTKDVLHM